MITQPLSVTELSSKIRARLGTIREMSLATGVSPATIYRIIGSSGCNPKYHTIERLSRYLSCDGESPRV